MGEAVKKSIIAAAMIAASLLLSGLAHATGEETPPPEKAPPQGCTPGYWKNHTDSWVTYESYHAVMDIIVFPTALYHEFAGVTIHQALSLKGGNGVEGAARILVRHAVAALLNVRHSGVNYPLEKDQIKSLVNSALASLDRDQILAAATFLMTQNELGCPLD